MIQSIWSFLSTVVVAGITACVTVWITQRIIAYWEGRKKIEQTKLSLYLSWMPFLADCYARARYPDVQPHDPKEFLRSFLAPYRSWGRTTQTQWARPLSFWISQSEDF